ncbi:hypothetical protein [Streptomyces gilvus]|nr:hypothetical protein [Streptomyces sp. CME 23]MCH5674915.1 hypothetical protein [Streptomyces sp. CME 23]
MFLQRAQTRVERAGRAADVGRRRRAAFASAGSCCGMLDKGLPAVLDRLG